MTRNEILIKSAFLWYRDHGFPYPDLKPHDIWAEFFDLQDKNPQICDENQIMFSEYRLKILNIDHTGIKIANFFNKHIWDSHAIGMRSPIDSFADDVAMEKAIRLALETTGTLTQTAILNKLKIVNGTQMCSNFRPMAAKAIYKKYYKEGNILDPSMGYGGRLLGFLSLDLPCKYIGVDPASKTCIANSEMAAFFGGENKTQIINSPFEDLEPEKIGKVGLIFTSPPYFKKEIYSNEPTQSCHRYSDYQKWLSSFWKKSIQIMADCLLDSGVIIINISDIKINNSVYSLINDTIGIMETNGLPLNDRLEMQFSGFGNGLEKFKSEPILLFKRS